MLRKYSSLLIALTFFIGVGCASPGSLASDEITDVAGVVVTDGYDRVANAEVYFSGDDLRTTTSTDGTFTLREVSVGSHEVNISTEGQGSFTKTVEVTNGGTRLEIVLD
ncbi:carboxypeptidase regulatory-like domain-containing protein [Rhodohalobacter halophilus]|uniref:carboxypeptidase regulatory-like domain-containing protein n=1 Tax=Rhodohalobacter halophilus TaxID=1812810 RepID=UPI00083FD18E|nr:carboxypeptidase regulatory-like domain-containing protein [Rhodohalobacter halophilus]